jgi:hypothetical protein
VQDVGLVAHATSLADWHSKGTELAQEKFIQSFAPIVAAKQ